MLHPQGNFRSLNRFWYPSYFLSLITYADAYMKKCQGPFECILSWWVSHYLCTINCSTISPTATQYVSLKYSHVSRFECSLLTITDPKNWIAYLVVIDKYKFHNFRSFRIKFISNLGFFFLSFMINKVPLHGENFWGKFSMKI